MIRRVFTAIICLTLSMSMVYADDLRTLFINMPDSIIPTLTKSDRMDFLDYMDSGMKASVRNKLGGESVLTAFSDEKLTLVTSQSGRLDMSLYKRKDGTNLICIIKTVTARYEDSHITFYNEDWTAVDVASVIELPQFNDYLTRKALKNDSLPMLQRASLLRLQSVTSLSDALDFRYTSLDYLGEDAAHYRSWFTPAPLRYTWNGKRFKKQ